MKKYEIMCIVNASLDDAAHTKLMDNFHRIIADHRGAIDKVDEWGVKEFAYEISHTKKGCYVVVNTVANDGGIHEFERLTRINRSVVRYMIIRTQDEE